MEKGKHIEEFITLQQFCRKMNGKNIIYRPVGLHIIFLHQSKIKCQRYKFFIFTLSMPSSGHKRNRDFGASLPVFVSFSMYQLTYSFQKQDCLRLHRL